MTGSRIRISAGTAGRRSGFGSNERTIAEGHSTGPLRVAKGHQGKPLELARGLLCSGVGGKTMRLSEAKRALHGYLSQLSTVQAMEKAGLTEDGDIRRAEADVRAMLNAIDQIRRGH